MKEGVADEERTRRLYVLVVICEIVVVAALWALGRVYA